MSLGLSWWKHLWFWQFGIPIHYAINKKWEVKSLKVIFFKKQDNWGKVTNDWILYIKEMLVLEVYDNGTVGMPVCFIKESFLFKDTYWNIPWWNCVS